MNRYYQELSLSFLVLESCLSPDLKGALIIMDEEIGVEITNEGNSSIVVFKSASVNDVDAITAASRQIKKFIEENQPKRLIFDFGRVKFFSSQVLGLLLDIRANLVTYGGEVVISAINPQLHRVFKITNLDKVFRFFPDKESGIKAVSTD
jgi:anti-sigma B factor antagonist